VVPHQLVRAADDRLYAFVARANGSPLLEAYRTSAPGVPASGADFAPAAEVNAGGAVVSVEAAYDGARTVHVLAAHQQGALFVLDDLPFDTATNSFGPAQPLASDLHPVTTTDLYMGSSGVSGMTDGAGRLHLAYWATGGHVVYRAYSIAGGALTLAAGPTTLDATGAVEHPALAVSPGPDATLTVAWVWRATASQGRIVARTASLAGAFGPVEDVSNPAVDVWTSDFFGTDVDQGPSLVVAPDGTRHLAYVEDFDASGDYGHVHHVQKPLGGTWADEALPGYYSHDPALAITSTGRLFVVGHGHPPPQAATCASFEAMCYAERVNGAWAAPQTLAAPPATQSFDASPSVKWSAVGHNRPETVELIFFAAPKNTITGETDYFNTILYYAHLGVDGAAPAATSTPTATVTPTPSPLLLGDQNIESRVDTSSIGRAVAFQYTASQSGTVRQLVVYLDASSSASKVVLGLYTDSGGTRPATLLAQGTITAPLSGNWNAVTVPSASVVAGTRYWIAVLQPTSTTGVVRFRDTTAGTLAQMSAQASLSSLPASWSAGTNLTNSPLSAYVVR
jgi:hypothetical protein